MRFRSFFMPLLVCLASPLASHADTLASFGAAGAANVNPNYLGEKFTTGGSGSYGSITFDFVSTSGSAYAIGTGYLLSQQYLGAPGTLSGTTSGYLGSAAANGGYYTFGSGVTLQSGQVYYFYENALAPVSTVAGGTSAPNTVEFYYAAGGNNFTPQPGASAAFSVSGTPSTPSPTVTPEPSSLILLATGITAAGAFLRKRFV